MHLLHKYVMSTGCEFGFQNPIIYIPNPIYPFFSAKTLYIPFPTLYIIEDGYYKTCTRGDIIYVLWAYIWFYMRQLELADPHQNYTPLVVFSELFCSNIYFFKKGLFKAAGPFQCENLIQFRDWVLDCHWNGLAALKKTFLRKINITTKKFRKNYLGCIILVRIG